MAGSKPPTQHFVGTLGTGRRNDGTAFWMPNITEREEMSDKKRKEYKGRRG